MLKHYFKWIGVVCLLVAIINQPLAAARLSCATLQSNTSMVMSNNMTIDSMDHAHHDSPFNGSQINDSQAISDCCEEQTCTMASCVLLPVIVVATALPLTIEHSTLLLPDYRAVYASAELVSPYRPPISR